MIYQLSRKVRLLFRMDSDRCTLGFGELRFMLGGDQEVREGQRGIEGIKGLMACTNDYMLVCYIVLHSAT